jgi:hypothetical protein
MRRIWFFLQNVFDNCTKGNFIKMLGISTQHYNSINANAGDAFFDTLIAAYEPTHQWYVDAYNAWYASGGTHEGGTATMEQLIADLSSTHIETWDIAIQGVYRKGTPQYIAWLPDGRKPFQSGSIESRINAVAALALAMGVPPLPLAATLVDINAKHAALVAARATQQGEITDTGEFSTELETARLNCAEDLYGNLGLLMNHFKETPEAIAGYFNLELIRSHVQRDFSAQVAESAEHFIAKRTVEPDAQARLINTGPTTLRFWIANEKNDPVGAKFIDVAPMEEEVTAFSVIGNVPADKYFKVMNTSAVAPGSFEIVMM